ncbi:hypothetical protein FV232_17580 [Methylobacterium sp. WL30]|jgi:hypothetical protein|uniref:hypothetical protein n=1 Tax=unclassified Methylobacterium TaxID=2615210 RepID=UPI0011CB71E2|nr:MULTISPECIES: hypothetical protein [unclassified Methylobacterium]MCJ2076432.1 hypothetical protein [Methylobacterium sp. E-016]MCJ2110397.1 hypothetical protein [Methylobacterium sp. E-025]TXM88262.1 hypothetical protein FV223_25060 [Methylobacterium sp. WL116]TXN20290.1 hypothetical protein FV225_27635 [Methylobacterium sp. WL93]TXN48883.1 hypothetical protein FV227_19290 [Methylobacterium sp. WL119]
MSEDIGSAKSHGILRWTIQTTGVAAIVALAAAHHFARADRNAEPTRMAQATSRGTIADPETTGSIAQGVRAVRLDPCNLPSGMRGLRP